MANGTTSYDQDRRRCKVYILTAPYGAERLEAASTRATQLRSPSYRTVKNILSSTQDRLPFTEETVGPAPTHDNIRGAGHYAAQEEEC